WMLAGRNTLHFCRNLQTSLVLKYFNYKKMNTFNQNQSTCEIVEVSCVDRWQVYKRLQELDIDCWCESEQPLQVYLKNTNEANQLESVLKQFTANRYELAQLLQSCWEVS
ncbi:MAG: hypothetical protein O4805_02055, partial [Trichodesmium sp. St16_bin2-tuft]|nr:hypothetical protein [Trichodesmium sp. St16_bin2-tuft]MDE5112513.1 hypothetical protein [Trichodesmium sp. St7_bin2_1]MDE5116243.1 hypothetical protein [Trichodesmium sp. St2_bin2_1]